MVCKNEAMEKKPTSTRLDTAPAVITVTGPNRPGVSAAFFQVLAARSIRLLDVEQSDFRGRLALAAFVDLPSADLPGAAGEGLEDELNRALAPLGQSVSVERSAEEIAGRPRSTHAVVVLGHRVSAGDVSAVGRVMADHGANIDRIRGISDYPVTGLEFSITVGDASPEAVAALRTALAERTAELGVDVAMERAGLARRSKRLVCFDCDSTLITGEVIEMLAAHAGREAEVARVTERAMRGEIDFEESLRERVAALRGLDESVLDEVARDIVLSPGARTTVRTLKRMGYTVAVVSGGFTQVLEDLAESLGVDYVRANTLEIADGKLTGRVVGQIVDRAAKACFLRDFAEENHIAMDQTVAVGDGANDIDMISAAGLGIAFNAKPALREVADTAVTHPFLDEVLHILGIPRDEVEAAEREAGTYRRVPLGDAPAGRG